MSVFSRAFWRATAERAIKSAAQGALVIVGGNQVDAWSIDGHGVIGAAAGSAIVSVLMSIVSSSVGPDHGPSVTGEVLDHD